MSCSVPRSTLPSTEQGAERTERPNIARCSVQFDIIPRAPVRFGCSVRRISRGCCSALVLDYDFFCKNLPISLFACSTLCSAHLLGGLLDSAARKTVTSVGLFGSAARSTALATPPLYSVRYSTSKSRRAWNTVFFYKTIFEKS